MRFSSTSWRRSMGQVLLLLLVAVPPAVLTAWWHPKSPAWPSAASQPGEVTLAELRQDGGTGGTGGTEAFGDVLWVDARKAEAFAAGHIPGAINLNEDDWEGLLPGFVERWDGAQRVVVYCDSSLCDASRAVAARLKRELAIGGPDSPAVLTLKGGWDAWLAR